jgi:hypothetical protein
MGDETGKDGGVGDDDDACLDDVEGCGKGVTKGR